MAVDTKNVEKKSNIKNWLDYLVTTIEQFDYLVNIHIQVEY